MFIVWIVLSIIFFFIIVETATSMWLNSDTEKIPMKNIWSFKTIQSKFLKKNVS